MGTTSLGNPSSGAVNRQANHLRRSGVVNRLRPRQGRSGAVSPVVNRRRSRGEVSPVVSRRRSNGADNRRLKEGCSNGVTTHSSGGGPAPQKSKNVLWIGIGIGAVLLIAIIITLVLVLGGGKYAGKERPSLPSEFGGWSKTDDGEGLGISIGNVYEKDGKQVLVDEFDFKLDDDGEPDIIRNEEFDESKFEETKPAQGVHCYTGEQDDIKGTACAVIYENEKGFSILGFDTGTGGKVPSKAEVENAAVELSKQK